jgi:hypothetical protein
MLKMVVTATISGRAPERKPHGDLQNPNALELSKLLTTKG